MPFFVVQRSTTTLALMFARTEESPMHVRAGFSQFLDSRLSLSPTFIIGELAGMTREKLEGMTT